MKNLDITGFLLAGGQSKRMRKEKGFVHFRGIPLAKYPLQLFPKVCNQFYINSNNTEYESFGIALIKDNYLNLGPLGGILTCLEFSTTEYNLFLPVDCPNVNLGLINHLIINAKKSEVTVPMMNNYTEPLIGIYKRSIRNKLNELLNVNMIKMTDVLNELNTNYVKIDEKLDFYDENLFKNINSPNELN